MKNLQPVRKPEIGVLFIHGIGEQERGQTLVNMAEPTVEWIDSWLKNIPHAWPFSVWTDAEKMPEQYRKYAHGEAKIKRSVLLPANPNTPPHIQLELTTSNSGRTHSTTHNSTWVLAESRWAASFPPPNSREVIGWTMKFMPWVVTSLFFKSRTFRSINSLSSRSWDSTFFVQMTLMAAYYFGLLLIALVSSPAILGLDLLMATILLFTFIPIPAIQQYVSWLLLKIAAIIGDSYIFAKSDMRQEAVITKVLDDLTWLERRCSNITIVAHSQGAAVAYYALQRKLRTDTIQDQKIRLLVTFGSGLAKLRELIFRRNEESFTYTTLAFLGIPIAGLAGLAITSGAIPVEYVPISLWVLITLILLLVTVDLLRGPPFSYTEESDFSTWTEWLKKAGVHWVDIYASNDPIPGGPMFGMTMAPESYEVHNRGSMWGDHTTYALNRDEFLPLIVTSIAKHSRCSLPLHDLTPKDGRLIQSAVQLRRYRVNFLTYRRWIIFLSMLSVAANTDALTILGSLVHGAIEKVGSQMAVVVPSLGRKLPLDIGKLSLGFMFALLLYASLLSLFTWTWKLVDSAAVEWLTWRWIDTKCYIGRPTILPHTRRAEVKFTDYMLRLLPWLGVAIAMTLAFPMLGYLIEAWQTDLQRRALGEVLLLTIAFAFVDLVLSYSRRGRFVRNVLEPAENGTCTLRAEVDKH
jgi:hypothetical protein